MQLQSIINNQLLMYHVDVDGDDNDDDDDDDDDDESESFSIHPFNYCAAVVTFILWRAKSGSSPYMYSTSESDE